MLDHYSIDRFSFSAEVVESIKKFPPGISVVEAIGRLREQGKENCVAELSYFIEEFGSGKNPIGYLLLCVELF